jgi:DNA-binding transcriptional regulator YdaS (Cro superfamily)
MNELQRATAASALAQAVSQAPSQKAFERLTGVKQQNVSNWLRKSQPLPAEHVLKVEQSTGVSRHLLRPDIYPADEPLSAAAPPVDCDPLALSHQGTVSG